MFGSLGLVYCDQCGVGASSHDRYCRIWGRPLASDRISAGLNYCDQCGAQVDLQDRYCRICGRQLNRPSTLWFDVSIVGRPTAEPLEPSRPVSLDLLHAPEEPSAAPPPVAVSDSAVIKRFAAEKGKQFLEDYHELQKWPSGPTEPSSIQLSQEIVVSSSTVSTDSHKTFVLEKESITNRKSPTQSESGSLTKLGNRLTKAVTKPPIAPTESETKPELRLASLTPKAEGPGKSQASIQAQTSATELGPTNLIPKLGALEKTQANVDTHISKHRHRSSSALIGYGLTGVGAISLILAVVFTSTVLAFIGLGLAFWGALLMFIRPRHYVRSDLMDSTALSSLTSIDRVITSLGYNQKGIYLPADNPDKTVVFIPAQPLKKMPKIEQIEKQVFVKDPEGITLVPPGLSLANFFERQLGVKFTDWSLKEMSERLPKLLIEDLEMVQDCTINIDGDNVSFRFVESVYAEFCSKLRDSTKVCASLGCPMCSAMACVLAQVSHRPVEFDKDKYTTDGGTVESSYHIIAG